MIPLGFNSLFPENMSGVQELNTDSGVGMNNNQGNLIY